VLGAVLATLITSSAAAGPLAVTGTVRSEPGTPLAGARVELRPMLGNHAWSLGALRGETAAPAAASALTSAGGRFALEAPAAGIWEVEVRAAGRIPMRYRPLPLAEPAELPAVVLPRDDGVRVEVAGAGGESVAGAWVLVESAEAEFWRDASASGWAPGARIGRCDERGSVILPRAAGETVRATAHAPARAEPGVAHGRERVRILVPGARRERTLGVRGAEGPLTGVAVVVGAAGWPVGLTGDGGTVALGGEFAQPLDVQLFAADGRRHRATLPPAAADAAPPAVEWVELPPRRALAGRVSAAGGEPLAGALVWPRHDPGTFVLSGRDGGFELAAAPYPRYRVLAAREGFRTGTAAVEAPPGGPAPAPLAIVLERRRAVVGRVLGARDRPVEGAEVKLVAAGSLPAGEEAAAATGADGRFRIAGAPGARFTVEVSKPGYAPLAWRDLPAPPGEGAIDLGVLDLVPGAAVEGTVSDPQGRPIAGARVWLLAAPGSSRRTRDRGAGAEPAARADAEGGFRLADLRPGEPVGLRIDADGYLAAEVPAVEPPTAAPLAVVLEPAARVSGRVVDAGGAPIAGAEVRLGPREAAAGTAGVPRAAGARELAAAAGADGRFEIAGVAAGPIRVEAYAPGFSPSAPLAVDIAPGRDLDGLLLVLDRGAVLDGYITDHRGDAVPGAVVAAGRPRAEADDAGHYRLEGVAPGRRAVQVEHPDYNRLVERVEVEPGENAVDFVLAGGFPVAGRVVDEEGTAVAGAAIELRLIGRSERRDYRAASGEDGTFRFASVADGHYTLAAGREGYGREERFDALAVEGGPVEGVEIVLAAAAIVSGRILGLPAEDLPRVHVQAERLEGEVESGLVVPEGRYEVGGLAPGEWRVTARLAGGRRQAEVRVGIERGVRRVERDLRFGGGVVLTGLVLYGGRPLPGTAVALRGREVAVERSVTTDHAGAFRLEDLEAGSYRLAVSNPRELVTHTEDLDLTADRDVVIEVRTVELRGRVVAETTGEPIAEALVQLYQYLGEPGGEPASLYTVATGPEGRFRQARLAAGSYRLVIQKDGYAPAERWLDLGPAAAAEDVEIALAPTQGLDLVVRLASGRAPVVVTVAAFDRAGRLALTEARGLTPEGYTRFATLPPGEWELWVAAPGGAVERRWVTVPAGVVEIVLPPAARLRVRVPALAGSNQQATVTLTDAAGRPFQAPEAGGPPRGEWRFAAGVGVLDGLPAGAWIVTAVGPRGEVWQRPVALAAGTETEIVLE
jgi:protocatechuate 3,4-dioxygenase beta subunit